MARGVFRGAVTDTTTGANIAPLKVKLKQGATYVPIYASETDPTGSLEPIFTDGYYVGWQAPGSYTIEFYKQTGGVWETTPFLTLVDFQIYPRPTYIVETDVPKTITAVHTFNPLTAGPPFTLGPNAWGQLVAGLNADFLRGLAPSALQSKYIASAAYTADTSASFGSTPAVLKPPEEYDPASIYDPATGVFTNVLGQRTAFLCVVNFYYGVAPADVFHRTALLVRRGAGVTVLYDRTRQLTSGVGDHTHSVSIPAGSTSIDGYHGQF